MNSTFECEKTICAREFTNLCELLWKQIRVLVELQCEGCNIESSEHLHSCQKLYKEYYLIHDGFLFRIYEHHFDQVFDDVIEDVHLGRITRLKKGMLKTQILSYIIECIENKSLFS